MSKILVICFSSVGHVAMTLPVIHSLATQYARHQIMVLSTDTCSPLFEYVPDNVIFRGADFRGEHAGLTGLGWLYNELKEERFDAVAAFRPTFRSRFLCWRFRLAGIKAAHIRQNKRELQKLIRRKHKIRTEQPSFFLRCANTLSQIGYPVRFDFLSLFGEKKGDLSDLTPLTGEKNRETWIGIAPFATRAGKLYPLSKQEQILRQLSACDHIKIFLFGSGKKETRVLETWAGHFPRVISTAGKLTLSMKLALMSHLDVMLVMDTADMHLASLVNIPVVSVWGATHPYAGFAGWNQSAANTIQTDLPCRPCSLSGEKRCHRKDYACLQGITPETVIEHLHKVLH